MDAIEAACNDANLLFVRYPVDALNFPGPDLEGLGDLFDDASQRVLAYCRTGTRCANLWVATRSEEERQAAIQVAREIGFDLSMVSTALNRALTACYTRLGGFQFKASSSALIASSASPPHWARSIPVNGDKLAAGGRCSG